MKADMSTFYFRGSHPEALDTHEGIQLNPQEQYEFSAKDIKDSEVLTRLLSQGDMIEVQEVQTDKKKKEGDS